MRSRPGIVVISIAVLVIAAYGLLASDLGRPAPVVTPLVASTPPDVTPSSSPPAGPTLVASATPTLRALPVDRPYPSAPPVKPARNDDLPLAGRDGVPGLLTCGGNDGLPFTVASLQNPTGAEDLPGPEYDALRIFLEQYATLGEFRHDPDVREVAHDAASVMLFVDQPETPGSGLNDVPVSMDLIDGVWSGYDGVDCYPTAVPPVGYEPATWTIDPAFSRPTPKTRALHVLVTEQACSSGKSASGRISPSYLVETDYQISIGVLVKKLPGGQDCPAAPPTPARISLPGPIGERQLRDMYDYLLNTTSGG